MVQPCPTHPATIAMNQRLSGMYITVRVKNNYGNNLVYPVCDKAKLFASIACSKTLTSATIKDIKSLGYKVIVENNLPKEL